MNANKQSAFTLNDLLAVMATIAVLALLALTTAATTRDKSLRAQCVNNLHQMGLALQFYGENNNGYVPLCPVPNITSAPYWSGKAGSELANLNMAQAYLITNSGVKITAMYCPSYTALFGPANVWWNYASDYISAGYWFMIMRNSPTHPPGPTQNNYPMINDTNVLVTRMNSPVTLSSNGVPVQVPFDSTGVVGDMVLSQSAGTLKDHFDRVGYNAGNITSPIIGSDLAAAGGYSSSHMTSGGRTCPGANILFQDLHVGWKNIASLTAQPWTASSGTPAGIDTGTRWEWYYNYVQDPTRQ